MRRNMILIVLTAISLPSEAADWPRFRGPDGTGVANDSGDLPSVWSPEKNIVWKTRLPGPGASSPIIVDGKVFVTCYSGYGLDLKNPGDIENLVRHLVCIDLKTGRKLWQRDVKVSLPEDPYVGTGVSSHGYASHTPVSDGKWVFAFFGKSGVHAFDLDGNKLWQADVGKESDPPKWGSASSPIVYRNTVIVTASAESQAIIGFDSKTGEELWRQEAKGLDGMWGTPTLVSVDEDRTDVVMLVAKELWGLDPNSGKLRWYAEATDSQQAYTSVVPNGKRVFAFTGRGGGCLALDVGGFGNVTKSNMVWTGNETARFASPVRHREKIYVVVDGVLKVVDATTGRRVQQLRLKGASQSGGRWGPLNYASPVIVGDRLYSLNGNGQMVVFALNGEVQQIAVNKVTDEKETFWGTPALSDGRLVLRSSQNLYCIADQSKQATAKNPIFEEPSNQSANSAIIHSGKNQTQESGDSTGQPTSESPSRAESRESRIETDDRYPSRTKDTRPDRPQRPESVKPQ